MPEPLEGIMEILITAKNVYGERKYYPVCEKAKTFAKIAGSITLTRRVLFEIKELGFKVTFAPETEEI